MAKIIEEGISAKGVLREIYYVFTDMEKRVFKDGTKYSTMLWTDRRIPQLDISAGFWGMSTIANVTVDDACKIIQIKGDCGIEKLREIANEINDVIKTKNILCNKIQILKD